MTKTVANEDNVFLNLNDKKSAEISAQKNTNEKRHYGIVRCCYKSL